MNSKISVGVFLDMNNDIPIQIGLSDFVNNYPNHISHMVNRITHILNMGGFKNNLILSLSGVDYKIFDFFKDKEKISIVEDNLITKVVSNEYSWFSNIKGYGYIRLIQYLLSPNGCIIRDQDTLEMDDRLLKYQFRNLGGVIKGRKICYIFSDYFGRGLPQIFNGPTPIDLNILDEIWYRKNSDDRQIKNGRVGKTLLERYDQFHYEYVGWGNQGSCAIDPSLFLNFPPIAGPIRGGDDSIPLRMLSWCERSGLGNIITPYQVSHMIYNQNIEISQTIGEIRKIIDTILFNPYWKIMEHVSKNVLKKYEKSGYVLALAEEIRHSQWIDNVKDEQHELIQKINDVFDKWSEKYPEMEGVRKQIKLKNSIGLADQTHELTLKLYENWKDLFEEISPDVVELVNPLKSNL